MSRKVFMKYSSKEIRAMNQMLLTNDAFNLIRRYTGLGRLLFEYDTYDMTKGKKTYQSSIEDGAVMTMNIIISNKKETICISEILESYVIYKIIKKSRACHILDFHISEKTKELMNKYWFLIEPSNS